MAKRWRLYGTYYVPDMHCLNIYNIYTYMIQKNVLTYLVTNLVYAQNFKCERCAHIIYLTSMNVCLFCQMWVSVYTIIPLANSTYKYYGARTVHMRHIVCLFCQTCPVFVSDITITMYSMHGIYLIELNLAIYNISFLLQQLIPRMKVVSLLLLTIKTKWFSI